MDFVEGKRTRKPVAYNLDDSDDDFSDNTPPVKKKKDTEVKVDRPTPSSINHDSNDSHNKEKEKDRRHKDKKEKKRDKDRDREKDRDRDKEKDRDRDKRDKDRDRHSKKNKHRDKERSRDGQEKSSSDEDRRKHKKDKKRDKRDKEPSDSKPKGLANISDDDDFKSCLSSPKGKPHPITSTQKSPGRGAPRSRLTVEERMFQRELEAALALSKVENASQQDPEEKRAEEPGNAKDDHQKEVNPSSNTSETDVAGRLDDPESDVSGRLDDTESGVSGRLDDTESGVSGRLNDPESGLSESVKDHLNFKGSTNTPCDSGEKDMPGEIENQEPDISSIEAKLSELDAVTDSSSAGCRVTRNNVDDDVNNVDGDIASDVVSKPSSVNKAFDETGEPLPSTSDGLTRKRQRKKVVFYEESDSDSFDGFEPTEMSEESDFAMSPVKKKGKTAKQAKKPKSPKASKSRGKEPSVILKSPPKSPSTPRVTPAPSVKENAAPVVNQASPTKEAPPVIGKATGVKPLEKITINQASPTRRAPPAVAKATGIKPPEKKTKGNKNSKSSIQETVSKPSKLINSSPSTTQESSPRIPSVKTPFRSPVISSGESKTPNFIPKSPHSLPKIGVRLGLSRSVYKPLHPRAVAK